MSGFKLAQDHRPPARTIASAYLNSEAMSVLQQLAKQENVSRSRIIESLLLSTGKSALRERNK